MEVELPDTLAVSEALAEAVKVPRLDSVTVTLPPVGETLPVDVLLEVEEAVLHDEADVRFTEGLGEVLEEGEAVEEGVPVPLVSKLGVTVIREVGVRREEEEGVVLDVLEGRAVKVVSAVDVWGLTRGGNTARRSRARDRSLLKPGILCKTDGGEIDMKAALSWRKLYITS